MLFTSLGARWGRDRNSDSISQRFRQLLIQVIHQMGVHTHRCCHLRMPQALLNQPHMSPMLHRPRHTAVPQRMKRHRPQPGGDNRRVPDAVTEIRWTHHRTTLGHKQRLTGLTFLYQWSQHLHQHTWNCDRAHTRRRFRSPIRHCTPLFLDLATHRHLRGGKVNITHL
ncbi:MAG: hypothetical protein P8J75_04225 [Actinomycetota bacterium]|nr:hypothetical protein [Actinomycetota bacterium]